MPHPYRFAPCILVLLALASAAAGQTRVLVTDSAGRPVPDAVVQVVDPDDPEAEPAFLTTGREGRVDLPSGTPAGKLLLVSAPGFLSWSGSVPEAGRITLLRPAGLRGRVLSGEKPVQGAAVRLVLEGAAEEAVAEAKTGEKGLFEVQGLQPGLHTLRLEADGHIPAERTVSLREGDRPWLDLEIIQASRLEVRVLGPGAKPMGGVEARVRTEGSDGRFHSEGERERLEDLRWESGPEDPVEIGPLARGRRHRIVFRHPATAPLSLVLTPEEALVSRAVRLSPGGSIRLRVQDGERRPVAGARVHLASDDVADLDLLDELPLSDEAGTLLLERLPPGTYTVRLQREGFRPATLREVKVEAGKTASPPPVELPSGLEIAGIVSDDLGEPLVAAEVAAVFYEEGRELRAEGETDDEGAFRLDGLPDGQVEMEVEAAGHLPLSDEVAEAGEIDLELVLERAAAIAGQVLDAETDLPVGRFRISVRPEDRALYGRTWFAGASPAEDVADAEGRFRMEGFLAERYAVTFRAAGYRPHREAGVETRPGETAEMEVRLERGLSVEGTVLDDREGTPVPGASVGARGLVSTTTDMAGRFLLEGLEGPTDLQVDHPMYVRASVPAVDPGEAGLVEVRLRRGGSIEGTVFRKGREPLPGAEVGVRAEGKSALTDAAGRYRIDGLPAGTLSVGKVDVPGSFQGYRRVQAEVREGETTTVDFGTGARLWGQITHEGAPASGAELSLMEVLTSVSGRNPEFEAHTARAGEDGSYEIHGLSGGLYGMTVVWEGRRTGRRLRIEEGPEQRHDVAIRDLWLEGQMMDTETRAPVRGTVGANPRLPEDLTGGGSVTMMFRNEMGEQMEFHSAPSASGPTDADGRFRLLVSEPGTYRLWGRGTGYRMPDEQTDLEVRNSLKGLELEMQPAIEMSVKILDAISAGDIASACVIVIREEPSFHSINCGSSVASFSGLRPGPAMVSAKAPGRALAYQRLELSEPNHEVSLSLSRGGALRILLPEGTAAGEDAASRAGLSIADAQGTDLLRLGMNHDEPWAQGQDAGVLLVDHAPPGPLTVSIGGGETGLPRKETTVTVSEGAEAVADLR